MGQTATACRTLRSLGDWLLGRYAVTAIVTRSNAALMRHPGILNARARYERDEAMPLIRSPVAIYIATRLGTT